MVECYTIVVEGAAVRFTPRDVPAEDLFPGANGRLPQGCEFAARLGDPALLHCAAFRRAEGPGGVFAVYDTEGPLFAAVAESNLAFALGMAHLGRMVTYARYGADIFDELGNPDD